MRTMRNREMVSQVLDLPVCGMGGWISCGEVPSTAGAQLLEGETPSSVTSFWGIWMARGGQYLSPVPS